MLRGHRVAIETHSAEGQQAEAQGVVTLACLHIKKADRAGSAELDIGDSELNAVPAV